MITLPLHRRLRFRLPVLLAVMVLAGSLVGALAAIHATERQFRAMLDEQFLFAVETTQNLFDLVGQMGLIWANHFTGERSLVDSMERGDRAALAARVPALVAESSADMVILLDREGRVLHRSHDPARGGDSLLFLKLARDAVMGGEVGSTVVQEANNFVVYSSGLVRNAGGERVGVVLVGYLVNDRFLDGVRKNTRVDITVVRRRAVMASTFNSGARRLATVPLPYTQYQILLGKRWRVSKLRLEGAEYFAAARPLRLMEPNMEGSLLVTYPAAELERSTAELREQFLWFSLGAALVVILLGVRLSGGMLDPMYRLLEGTRRVAEGDDAVAEAPRVEVKGRDEAGMLAEEFNRLLQRIHEQRRERLAWGERLEWEVAERTEALEESNRQLAEEKGRAEEATRLKDRYVSLVAHDLKTPFSTVIGVLQVIDEEHPELDPEMRQLVHMSLGSSRSALEMIQNVLDISRFQSGNLELQPSRVALRRVTLPALANLAHAAREKGVKLVDEVPEGVEVRCDLNLMIEVVTNLISNAVKFSNPGDEVRLAVPEGGGLAVIDAGTGIPDALLPDLFRHEVKTSMAGTAGERGTGFGLPLCHDIVAAHGGELTVRSRSGEGSVFTVRLPG